MEIFLNRGEMRRRLRARLGTVTNDAQAGMAGDQHNELLRSASLEVYGELKHAQAKRETEFTIETGQRYVNYPANCTPGNIISIAIWDEDELRFVHLSKHRVTPMRDDDQIERMITEANDEGDTDEVERLTAFRDDQYDRPQFYEFKSQLELWPKADKKYYGKIDHTVSPDLNSDDDVSVVDSEAVILFALSEAFAMQGDDVMAKATMAKATMRIGKLRAFQHTNEYAVRGRGALRREQRGIHGRNISGDQPNYDTTPSTNPDA